MSTDEQEGRQAGRLRNIESRQVGRSRNIESRQAGRPRNMESRQAIIDATLSLLATQGFDAMSIEKVAVHANVGKTTIYRWWDSKEALALEALQSLYTRRSIVDTGDLRHDLIAMFEDTVQFIEQDEPLLENLTFKMLGYLQTHPELAQIFYARIAEPRMKIFSQMIERAQERGELRRDIDPFVIFGLFGGPFFYRMLLHSNIAPRGPDWVKQVVDAILNGIAIHKEN